ncbi:protease inhibitor I42 family protein [Chitinibacter bivalviorum]|uniref:Protease inhibitor I42 family protein n=1 Tax=Chitinibacter bivalviorum TaxID=2739434 RepID=A0A7H9BLB5_9NEIS|nr:protease inhibitor I42 family protein [Chitinibacter bivalviorum]QLG89465.1 protease inhibitor I42 family protein [Chitinibacter bivalviorum]
MKNGWLIALSGVLLCHSAVAERVLTPLQHQQTIVIKPKEAVMVKLPASPNTGYLWFFEKPNSEAMKLVQDWKFTPWNKNQLNSPGDSTWRFRAQQEGEVTLKFVYRKPWEGPEIEPLDFREYKIIISNKKPELSAES